MIVYKTVWNAVLVCNLKNDRRIAIHFQAKPFTSTVMQVCALNSNAEEAEVEWFPEDVQGLLEVTSKKMSFSSYWTGMQKWEVEISGLTGKFGVKSTKWSRRKSNRVLPRKHTGHSAHPLPKTQVKTLHMDITKCAWKTLHTHGQYPNQIDYILCSQRWRSSIQSAKTRLGADCGSDHELLVVKFILKLKKDVKTTRHSGMT